MTPVPSLAAQPAFLGPQAKIFTLAGGGTDRPRDGLPATRVRLPNDYVGSLPLVGLPDGSIATTDERDNPFAIGIDGRIHMLPRILDGRRPERIENLTSAPDGSLVATTSEAEWIYRLSSGSSRWTRVLSLRQVPGWARDVAVTGLAALSDGGFAASWTTGLGRVDPDGRASKIEPPDGRSGLIKSVVAMPDASLAFVHREGIAIAGPDGKARSLAPSLTDNGLEWSLAALADGRLLAANDSINLLDERDDVKPLAGWRPGLGIGDGASPVRALVTAEKLAVTADGALAISEANPLAGPNAPLHTKANVTASGTLVPQTGSDSPETGLRIIVGPDSQRPLAAITPATFGSLRSGTVHYASTFAGAGTLEARHNGRIFAKFRTAITAGDGVLRLPRRPPTGAVRLRLRVRANDGREALAHFVATTAQEITRASARSASERVASNEGDIGAHVDVGHCQRLGDRRIDCQAIEYSDTGLGPTSYARECDGIYIARLRPDGIRVVRNYDSGRCLRLERHPRD